jgi:hypothetical protein
MMLPLNYENPTDRRILRGTDYLWQCIAESLGGEFVPGSLGQMTLRKMYVPAHPWTIVVEEKPEYKRHAIRARAVFRRTDNLRFRIDIREAPIVGRLERLMFRPVFARRLVMIGDSAFDNRTYIQCSDIHVVKELITASSLGELLMIQGGGIFRIEHLRTDAEMAQLSYSSIGLRTNFDEARIRGAGEIVRRALVSLATMGHAELKAPDPTEA